MELGILHDEDSWLADRMLDAAAHSPLYRTERNEPYGPEDGVTHTLKLHGLANGLHNVMIEVRNDLIGDDVGQGVVAGYLTGLIQSSLEASSIEERTPGSSSTAIGPYGKKLAAHMIHGCPQFRGRPGFRGMTCLITQS